MKKRMIAGFMAAMAAVFIFTGCSIKNRVNTHSEHKDLKDNGKLNVVTTLFPYYDFIRQIAGDKVNLIMVVPAGMDTHSFEPTTEDMIHIQDADVFIYNGGSIEHWVEKVLASSKSESRIEKRMMDYVEVLAEEHKEGMEDAHKEHDDEEEIDEHIWTSPVNVGILAKEICNTLIEADSANAAFYQSNCDAYVRELEALDKDFHNVTDNARIKTMVFADKFPLRYFTEEYGLDYYAAFNGCSTDTEPSVDTVKFLIDKVKSENIRVVYYLELSSQKIADTICSSTDATKKVFYSCHNVSRKQFDKGITYVDMMKENLSTLEEGLK